MSDNEATPIYDSVNDYNGHTADTEPPRAWLFTEAGRRWLYTIAAAVLVVVAGYLGLSAADQESWLNLVGAILNIGGAGALTYARGKVA